MRSRYAARRGGIKAALTRLFPAFSICLLAGLFSAPALAQSLSDRLIVLQSDARSYVEQHTLISDDQLLVVPLPAGRTSLETRFSGPERLTFSSAHERSPDRLSLWSGSVLTRYRHRYGTGLSEPEPGVFQLDVAAEHAGVQHDEPATVQWSISWVLPDNARLLDFGSPDGDASGRWTRSGPLISYQQNGAELPHLMLRFSLIPLPPELAQPDPGPCRLPDAFSDACSPDVDGDQIPDHRDVCLPPDSQVVPLHSPEQLATPLPQQSVPRGRTDQPAMQAIGCDSQHAAILNGVRFDSGQTYLNLASRMILDRVARAVLRLPERRIEILAHTDNAGRVEHNQALSDSRARTIRHYLMLRGIEGARIRARGLGETTPAFDNALAAGRRANRRVELRVLE